jgi:hypothetical protein
MATMTPSRAEELLAIDEAAAWFEYLEATHGQPLRRYEEVEPWAWTRLGQRLRTVAARRDKLVDSPRRTNAAEGASPAGGVEDDGA